MDDVTIAIVAGGRSSRMGQNKSFVPVHGKPMIEHILERLTPLNCPIILITNESYDYEQYKLPMFSDVFPDQGSLGGIYTALHFSETPYVLCTACDMPFLNTDVLRYLLNLRTKADGVAAYIDDLWHTFPAVYHTCLAPVFHTAMSHKMLRLQKLLNSIEMCAVSSKDLVSLDPALQTFMNINTPDELKTAQTYI